MAIPTPTIRRTATTRGWFAADSGSGGPVCLRDLYAAYIACRRGKRQARNTWAPDVRERLRASWASTLGHLSHAASRRQALALWRRHPWARSAFALDAGRFRLVNRFEPASVASYAGQKRWFARRFPGCVVLVQKGREYELDTGSATSAGTTAPPRFTASHLPRLIAALRRAGRAYVIVREQGYLKRGLKRRVLSEIGWPASQAPLAASLPTRVTVSQTASP